MLPALGFWFDFVMRISGRPGSAIREVLRGARSGIMVPAVYQSATKSSYIVLVCVSVNTGVSNSRNASLTANFRVDLISFGASEPFTGTLDDELLNSFIPPSVL